ncbi:MAG: 4-alpha-glucanotransferase [Spirochaetes bacterium]|nr:4-alpha-glucanotransferase [Spirochaetota bacterium]MBU1080389.1 4-alpha-glucanotransferase [Spirochaetota bacterium]
MRYPAPGRRLFGISVPLGSIRASGGWRVGEYPDLVPFCRLCSGLGAGLVQILPVNDTGSQSSPYSALSAFALHPLYVRVRDLPEAAEAPSAVAALDAFAAEAVPGERFPYADCLAAKLAALRAVYDASRSAIAADPALAAFAESRPWVKTYAVFKRLKSSYGERAWPRWPERRDPTKADIEALWLDPAGADEQLFHVWTQMRASEQFREASRAVADAGLALLGDIPILMNEDSADAWSDRDFFDSSLKAGAPPDMYSEAGQNWGFPIYDWDAMERAGYSFWRARIAEADRYYSAFRIDHVLGFFRIWALGDREETGSLGRFVPGALVGADELSAAGFSAERLRWLSEPHIGLAELRAACSQDSPAAAEAALDRIGDEDLFLFKRSVRGEADISGLGLPGPAADFLKERWRDRALLVVGADSYAPTWRHRESRAWASLSDAEREALGSLFARKGEEAERGWEEKGRALLSMLKGASSMLPCAEDLGAVPDCVPRVLEGLGIPGLRVPRWMRRWDEPGQPFKPLSEYSVLSACTPSVHDTSTLRAWWDYEDGREEFAAAYCPGLSPAPPSLDTAAASAVLRALAGAPSLLYVLQLQDLLDLSEDFRSADPRADRVNVPGTVDAFNWTWRMGYPVEELEASLEWKARVRYACCR